MASKVKVASAMIKTERSAVDFKASLVTPAVLAGVIRWAIRIRRPVPLPGLTSDIEYVGQGDSRLADSKSAGMKA